MNTGDALISAGQAIGVIDEAGSPSSEFFAHPLEHVGGMLRNKFQRERLVVAVDALLQSQAQERPPGSGADSKIRYYRLLPDGLAGQLCLVAHLNADVDVTFAIDAYFEITALLTGRLEIPLVRAKGDGEDPLLIAGGPDGRIRVKLVQMIETATVEVHATAWVVGGIPKGSFGVRLEGLVVDGAELPALEFSTDELVDGAIEAIMHILQFLLQASVGTDLPIVQALAEHLPGLFGATTDVGLVFPFVGLAADPSAFTKWLAQLAADDAVRLKAWFKHLAGLLGDASPLAGGSPTAAVPWRAALTTASATPSVAMEAWLEPGSDGYQRLAFGLLVRFAEDTPARVAIDARVELARIPLGGAAAVEAMPEGSIVISAPVDGSMLVDTADVKIGSIRGGLRWNAAGVRPVIEVLRLQMPGSDKLITQIDLSDGDAVADTMRQEATDFLKSRLSAPGAIGSALLTLTGLDGDGPATDLGLLTTAPTRAIGDHHRRCVLEGLWADRHLRALGDLLGVASSEPIRGTGMDGTPWRLTVAGTSEAHIELVAVAQANGDKASLTVGLGFGSSVALSGQMALTHSIELDIGIASFELAADTNAATTLLPSISGSLLIDGIGTILPADVPLRYDSWSAMVEWFPGGSMHLSSRVSGLTLAFPELDVEPIALGNLVLPAVVDFTQPDLGLGLDPSGLVGLFGHLAGQAVEAALATDDRLYGIVSNLVEVAVQYAPGSLVDFATNPAQLASTLFARPFDPEGPLAPVVPDALDLLSTLFAGFKGSGSNGDVWISPLGTPGSATYLTAWLAPEGTSPAAGDITNDAVPWSSALLAEAGVPTVHALMGQRDAGVLTERLGRLADYFESGDGLVVPDTENPPDVMVESAHQEVIAHPDAIAAITAKLNEWRAGDAAIPVVIIVPSLLGLSGLDPLRATLAGASEQIIDLNRSLGGPDPLDLSRYVPASVHIVVTDDQQLDQLSQVLDHLLRLHDGHQAALVGVSVAAPAVVAVAEASPASYVGVITVASPADGEGFDPYDFELVDAIRFVRGLTLADGPHGRAIGLLAQIIDGWLFDAGGQRPLPTPIELLQASAPTAAASLPTLRIGGTCGEGFGDIVSSGLFDSDTRSWPDALALGIATPFLPTGGDAATEIIVDSHVRLDLASIGPVAGSNPALALQIRVGRKTGYLLGPSSPANDIQVGGLELLIRASLISTDATAALMLTDVVVRGVHYPLLGPSDGPFATCLQKVVSSLGESASQSTAVAELLGRLSDGLGIVKKPPANSTNYALLADALGQLLGDPRSWLAQRGEQLLDAAWTGNGPTVFGLAADRSAPAGSRRWTWISQDIPVKVTVTADPWTVTVESSGGPIAINPISDRLRIGGRCVAVVGTETTYELDIGFGSVGLHRAIDGTITLVDPLFEQPVTLSDQGGPASEQTLSQLAGPAGAALGASVLISLIQPYGGDMRRWRALASLIADPATVLHDALHATPAVLGNVFAMLAPSLGLQTNGNAVTLVPGALTIDASPVNGRPTITLATPVPIQPIPEVSVQLQTALGIDDNRNVHPGFDAQLRVQLGGSADAWPELGLRFGIDEQGPRVSFDMGEGKWIDLLPHFAGVGVLVGSLLDRLLPRALDLVVEETAASDVKNLAIDVAKALDIYNTSFSDGAVPLGQLTAGHVVSKASALVLPVVNLLNQVVGATLPPGTITAASGNAIRIHLPSVLDGQFSVRVGFDPLAVTASLTVIRATALLADVSVTGSMASPHLSANLGLGVDLEDVIGLAAHPMIVLHVASEIQPLSVAFHPLGDANATNVSIDFLPAFATTLTETGTRRLVEAFAVTPALHVAAMLLEGSLDDALWDGGPSLKEVLVAGKLLDGATNRIATTLPAPVDLIAGAAGAVAGKLNVDLNPTLALGFGDAEGLGPQLRGYLPFTSDSTEIRVLMGNKAGLVPPGPLAIDIFRPAGAHWNLQPQLRVNHTGVAVLGAAGKDLVTSDFIRFGGFGAHLGFAVDIDVSGSTPTFSVGQWAAGVDLTRISIPALSGGGGDSNPIASGMLASTSGGEPVQPQFDLEVSWDGQLHVRVVGSEPGKPIWIPIDRGFGPLYIARIGIETGKGSFRGEPLDYVGLLVDGAISMAGLSVSVKGLTVQVPPKYLTQPDHWAFDLEALAVSYENSSVTIAGGLLKEGSGAMTQYLGMLQITVSGRGISALGGYGRTKDGEASLFVFVVINAPLGGPPYLFITGAAGGFGFNRRLLVPGNPEQVPQFPLMAALAGRLAGDPNTHEGAVAILDGMAQSIPPERGMIWLAAGVKFTTFVMLETNAILYVQFGNGFEVGLLGLMAARLPSADSSIAAVELGMLAKYSTVDNTLAVRAQLTANSWLFTKDCRLTGGFAFMVWFNLPQAMVSLGGYHSDFPVPSFYPLVPRVGFRWSPAKGVTVKGESDFAITPEAAMTGGRLEARAEVNGIGYGEFTLYLDALLWFDPPSFILDFGMTISGKAFGFGFSVGARVHVELPPFHALVHVDFMWGFDIEFGQKRLPPYIDFPTFANKFLGGPDVPVCALAIKAGPAAGDGPQDQGKAGLTRDNPLRVVPEFAVVSSTKFPTVTVDCGGVIVGGPSSQVSRFYLVPMGPPSPEFAPTHHVLVTHFENGQQAISRFTCAVETTGVPSALYWDASNPIPNSQEMQVDYSNMAKMVGGVQLSAESTVFTGAGLAPIRIADLVDEQPPLGLPLPAGSIPPAPVTAERPRAAATMAAPAASRKAVAMEPRLRWERTPMPHRTVLSGRLLATSTRSSARGASHRVTTLQLWSVVGDSWCVHAERRLLVRQFNAAGRLVATSTATRAANRLHSSAVVVAVQPAPARVPAKVKLALSGWQLHTRAHPVAPSAFVTATCSVAFAVPVNFPTRLPPDAGIDMFSLAMAAGTVVTDLPITTKAVVIQLDRLATGIDAESSSVVACEQAALKLVDRMEDAGGGRVHLVFQVGKVDAHADHLLVTVATRRGADGHLTWLSAGVIAAPVSAADLAARIKAAPQATLITDEDTDIGIAPPPITMTFTRSEALHG